MNTITDQELLTRHVRAHDPTAMRELMVRHAPMVYATARRLAPSDAEDVTQAVFLLLWQKAARLKGMSSVAGWLYRATRYACRNANKVRGRREYYEREAAMLRREVTEAAEPQIRALLDEGLARLGETNRQAVLLRYLEGLSAEETAGRLGMTPTAAAKRAERGVERLRAFLGSRGYSMPAASLAGAMAVEAAHSMPAAVAAGLEQLVGGAAAGGSVASLTAATAKAMIMAKIKVVAVSLGMTAVVGIGVAGGLKLMAASDPAKATQTPLAPPVRVQLATEDEAKVPGSAYVYRHELLIEQALCQAILKDATRVPSEGKWEVYRMATPTMREWLVGAPKGRVHYSFQHGPSVATPENAPEQRNSFENFYSFGSTLISGQDQPFLQAVPRGMIRDRLWTDAQGIHFPLKGNDWKVEINGVPGGNITKAGSLSADAVLQPGESLVCVLKVGQLHDGEYSFIVAMDVFKASSVQAGRITDLREAELWTRFGPGLCRKIADRAGEWQRNGHLPEQAPAAWQKKLSDGTVVQLERIASASRYPAISWDGDGKPLQGWGATSWAGDPGKLSIAGRVHWTTAPMSIDLNGRTWGDFNKDKPSQWSGSLEMHATSYRMRVPVGEFQNAGRLERRKAISVGPLKVELRQLEKKDSQWSATVDVTGSAADRFAYAIAPVVVTKSGLRVGPENNMSEGYYYRDPAKYPSGREPMSISFARRSAAPFSQDEFDHLELLWRKAEIVTFEGFATTPTGVEMADLEKAVKDARRPVVGKAAAVAPLEPAPAAELPDGERPADSMQLLLAAISAGDRAEMQKYLTGNDTACKTFTDAMLARQQLVEAIKKRLGTVPDIRGLTEWTSFDWELLKDEYKLRDDGIAICGQIICRRDKEGVWKLDLDQSFGQDFTSPRMQEMTQAGLPMARKLTDQLNAGNIATADQLRKAFESIVSDVRKTQAQ